MPVRQRAARPLTRSATDTSRESRRSKITISLGVATPRSGGRDMCESAGSSKPPFAARRIDSPVVVMRARWWLRSGDRGACRWALDLRGVL